MSGIDALERERDVLRHLVAGRGRAMLLWDHCLKVVWISPEAQAWISEDTISGELKAAACAALRNGRREESLSGSELVSLRPSAQSTKRAIAKFFWVCTADGPWLAAELTSYRATHEKLATLTRAETDVLRFLVDGLSNREIGEQLCVSVETVRTHVHRILGKLNVSSRSKAATVAREAWETIDR